MAKTSIDVIHRKTSGIVDVLAKVGGLARAVTVGIGIFVSFFSQLNYI